MTLLKTASLIPETLGDLPETSRQRPAGEFRTPFFNHQPSCCTNPHIQSDTSDQFRVTDFSNFRHLPETGNSPAGQLADCVHSKRTNGRCCREMPPNALGNGVCLPCVWKRHPLALKSKHIAKFLIELVHRWTCGQFKLLTSSPRPNG